MTYRRNASSGGQLVAARSLRRDPISSTQLRQLPATAFSDQGAGLVGRRLCRGGRHWAGDLHRHPAIIFVDIRALVLRLTLTVELIEIACERLRHRLIGE
jgi:hypothetical protein